MLVPLSIAELAKTLGQQLLERRYILATAESCTGGAIGSAITSTAGSSQWYEFGLVTYSNGAKSQYLHVAPELIAECGAVSEQVVSAMLVGLLEASGADVGITVSGIAGPDGGTPGKPVGTVCFAWGHAGAPEVTTTHFAGDRDQVREAAVAFALSGLISYLSE